MKIVLSLSSYLLTLLLLMTINTADAQCITGVRIKTIAGGTSFTACKDGSADVIGFKAARAGKLFAYAVVNPRNNRVEVLTKNPMINFDNLPVGIYRVYGINYFGSLNSAGGTLGAGYLASVCSQTSPNWITVTVSIPNAGRVNGPGGMDEVDIVVGENTNAILSFSHDRGVLGALDVPARYAYMITNRFNVIIGISTSRFINFSNAGAGVCRVYGFAYTGSLATKIGDDIDWAMSTLCSDVTGNYITVNRISVDANESIIPDNTFTDEVHHETVLRNIDMFPNPAIDVINLQYTLKHSINATQIQVFDLLGKKVINAQAITVDGRNEVTLNINQLAKGTYVVRLTNGKQTRTSRFIKQ